MVVEEIMLQNSQTMVQEQILNQMEMLQRKGRMAPKGLTNKVERVKKHLMLQKKEQVETVKDVVVEDKH